MFHAFFILALPHKKYPESLNSPGPGVVEFLPACLERAQYISIVNFMTIVNIKSHCIFAQDQACWKLYSHRTWNEAIGQSQMSHKFLIICHIKYSRNMQDLFMEHSTQSQPLFIISPVNCNEEFRTLFLVYGTTSTFHYFLKLFYPGDQPVIELAIKQEVIQKWFCL